MDEREASPEVVTATVEDAADDQVEGASLPQDDADRDGVPAIFESRALAAFGYLSSAVAPWLIFVPVLSVALPPLKKSDYMRYHGWNALLLHVAVSAVAMMLNLACLWLTHTGEGLSDWVNMLTLVRLVLVPTAATILGVYLGYEAIRRRPAHMPLLSRWAEKAANGGQRPQTAANDGDDNGG